MRQTLPNLCWLRDSERRGSDEFWALEPENWSAEPDDSRLSFYAPEYEIASSPCPWLLGKKIPWPDVEFEQRPRLLGREEPSSQAFADWHGEILTGIESGQWRKIVPWAVEKLEFASELNWRHFSGAFAPYPSRFNYGFSFGEEGHCGVTPELLFRVRDGVLDTMALAGTGAVDGPSLLEDRKERLEHELVIEDLAQVLGPLGAIDVGQTAERTYGSLKHLWTPISVRLRESPRFADLVKKLHPTAALGGWPRGAAAEHLKARGGQRGRFGAPFGIQFGAEMLCVVAIRGLSWRGREAWLMSGCGVVAGSRSENEWRELALKRRATAETLGLDL